MRVLKNPKKMIFDIILDIRHYTRYTVSKYSIKLRLKQLYRIAYKDIINIKYFHSFINPHVPVQINFLIKSLFRHASKRMTETRMTFAARLLVTIILLRCIKSGMIRL